MPPPATSIPTPTLSSESSPKEKRLFELRTA